MHYLEKSEIFEAIHKNSFANITICMHDDTNHTFKSLCYGKYSNVKLPSTNSFFSINTFTAFRKKENIMELKGNFLDFDFAFEKDRIRFLVDYKTGKFNALPKPTIVFLSGHGVWFLWLYKDVAYCRKGKGKDSTVNQAMLLKWRNIQKLLFEKTGLIADYHALDVARVMRPDGSINAKPNMSPVKTEIYEYNSDCLYTLEELYTALTGMTRQDYFAAQAAAKKPKRKKTQNRQTAPKSNNPGYVNTNIARVEDLEKLVELRPKGFCEGCGYRELYLFVYAYHIQILTKDINKTLQKVRDMNAKFTDPLPDKELETAVINTVEQGVKDRNIIILTGPWAGKRKGYNYKTKTLIQMFEITPEEQEQLRTLCSKDIKYKRNLDSKNAKIRNNNGLTAKEQKKIDNIYIVHTYANQGLKQIEIADITGLSKGTVCKYLKENCPDINIVTSNITTNTTSNQKAS